MLDVFYLEPRRELRRRVVIVLDRITRARHAGALETRDGVQELQLHGDGQGSREAVHVQLGGIEPLGLEEDLVALGRRELHDLVLDRGAIAWPATADRAAVQRRLLQVALDDVLELFAGPCDPAGHLTRPLDTLVEGEAEVGAVAVLPLDLAPVHGAAIDARRRAGLEARYYKSNVFNHLRHLYRWLISRTARRNLGVGADVNATAEESAGCDDDGARAEATSVFRLDPGDPRAGLVEEQICDHPLREVEGRESLEQRAHRATIERPVALRARGPDGRALGAIQHAELNGRAIGGAAHDAAQCIDLADDGTLGDSTNSRIAGHLADRIQDGSEQQSLGSEARRHGSGLGAGVATTDDDYVIIERHWEKLQSEDRQRLGHRRTAGHSQRDLGRSTATLTFRRRPKSVLLVSVASASRRPNSAARR